MASTLVFLYTKKSNAYFTSLHWPAKKQQDTPSENVIAYTKSQIAAETNWSEQDGPDCEDEIV